MKITFQKNYLSQQSRYFVSMGQLLLHMHLYKPQASRPGGNILTEVLREKLSASPNQNHRYFLLLHPGSIVLRQQRASQLWHNRCLIQEKVK